MAQTLAPGVQDIMHHLVGLPAKWLLGCLACAVSLTVPLSPGDPVWSLCTCWEPRVESLQDHLLPGVQ